MPSTKRRVRVVAEVVGTEALCSRACDFWADGWCRLFRVWVRLESIENLDGPRVRCQQCLDAEVDDG